MTMTKIPDIAFDIQSDFISLEQDSGCGEKAYITLHRIHLEHIANQLGLPVVSGTAETIMRRLNVIAERLHTLIAAEHYRKEIVERCGSGIEYLTELDAIDDLAYEFLQDICSNQK